MNQCLVNHWEIAIPIAVAALNIIALIAILFARRASDRAFSEISKALREIIKLSESWASRSVVSLEANKDRASL